MASVIAVLDLDTVEYDKALSRSEAKAKDSGNRSANNFSNSFSGAFKGVAITAAVSAALVGATRAVSGFVAQAVKLENYETQFKTILKSTSAAQRQLQDLRDFAATTPFQLEGLATSTNQLLSFGVAQKNIIPTLRQLGDLAAGTGAEITDLTIPFGRLVSTQKLTLVELDKFADRGINLYGKLSEQTGISLKNIRDEISKGRVPFDEFTKALSDLTSEGGTFFGATLAQSKTLGGLFSTLKDNFAELQGTLGKTIQPILKIFTEKLIIAVGNFNKFFKQNGADIINNIFTIAKAFSFLATPFVAIKRTVEIFFQSIKTGFFELITLVSSSAEKIAGFGKKFGIQSDFLDDLSRYKEEIQAIRDESRDTLAETLDRGLINPEAEEKLAMFVENLRAKSFEMATITDETMTSVSNTTTKTAEKVGRKMIEVGKKISATMKTLVVGATSQAIQRLATNLVKGKSVFEDFGTFVLGIMGDMAIKIGEVTLASGIAMSALGKLSPTAAIAAGAALIAIGAAIKAASASAGTGASASGGGFSGGSIGGFSDSTTSQIEEDRSSPQTSVSVNIQGDVLDSEESGMRIVNILNDAFDKQGVVLT